MRSQQNLALSKKFMARYFTYKDWRDRGLVIRAPEETKGDGNKAQQQIKKYRTEPLKLKNYNLKGAFFPEDMISVVDDEEKGRSIYNDHWFGQYGTYKVKDHGQLNKLDIYETLFLINSNVLAISNFTKKEIIETANKRRSDFQKLYDVYADWRSKGYVIKTGFKFGTHFRVYFPGAQPIKTDEKWIHSMHVIHVFPRDAKLLISEWARVIRVAHSVRKTFILAIPGKSRKKTLAIDFVLYHRREQRDRDAGQDKATVRNALPKRGRIHRRQRAIGHNKRGKGKQAGAYHSNSRQGNICYVLQSKKNRTPGKRLRVL